MASRAAYRTWLQLQCLTQEESCSSSLPFLASAGLIFPSCPPWLCCLLSSCKFPKGRGFHYFPWEAISYQDVPTDTRLSFSLLLHTPFCFTLEGFSLPCVYASRVSVCNQTSILVIAYLPVVISALVVCQSFQQTAQFSRCLSFVFRLKTQLVLFLRSNYVCFMLVSVLICCSVSCVKHLLSVIPSFRYPY